MINKITQHIKYRAGQIGSHASRYPFLCSDYAHTLKVFKRVYGYELNLDNPETFNEKVNWRKLFDRKPIYTQMSDKLAVREYVSRRIGQEYLIEILQVAKKPEHINTDMLPKSFVIKTNHGSGMNLIVYDKEKLNLNELNLICRSWLNANYYAQGREWGYKHVKPRLMVEPLLRRDGETPLGFKFFCFDGKVNVIQTDIFTSTGHYRNLYSPAWEQLVSSYNYPNCPFAVQAPRELKQMVSLAEKLSDGYDFLRIDLYNHFGKIYFNEITIYPFAGFARFEPVSFDHFLGSFWKLPESQKVAWPPIRKALDSLDYLFLRLPRWFVTITDKIR